MTHWYRQSVVALAIGGASVATVAQKPPKIVVNNGEITFRALLDRNQDLMQPKVGNGAVANPKYWSATVEAASDGIPCTGTLLGPEVLLTAAHCVGDKAKAEIKFDDGTKAEGTCTRHPDWTILNPSADWALCRMEPIDRKRLYFEHLSLDANVVKAGSFLVITGYGCIDLPNKNGDGLLRTGTALIQKTPDAAGIWPHWLVTQPATDGNGSFACPGDSGGAAYLIRPDRSRRVVAVISAVGADDSEPDFKSSYLSTTGSGALANFLSKWRKDGKPQVCGLHPNPPKCRPTPP